MLFFYINIKKNLSEIVNQHEEHRRREDFSAALPRTSDTVVPSSREEVPPQWSAAVELTPFPLPSPLQQHRRYWMLPSVCYMLRRDTPMEEASDLMLLERAFCFLVPPLRTALSALDTARSHLRPRLWFRRAHRRPKLSHPAVTSLCQPRLLLLKNA
jgi:hypothetical protein